MRRVLANQELLLIGLMALLVLAVSLKFPDFFGLQTLFNVLTASMVGILFAVGVMLVVVSGGIDVSFLAVGILSAYATVKYGPQGDGPFGALPVFALSTAIGLGLGLVNAAVVIVARTSVLIATLATSSIYLGTMFAFVGGEVISTLPQPLQSLGSTHLFTAKGAVRGTTSLNILILVVLVVCVLVWAFLRFTIAGRSVFAVGGDAEAASRAAISVPRTRVLVFAIAGAVAGLAGIISVTLSGRADPTTFMGRELDTLAAVVLGGVAIAGGKGTVRGAVLGVLLISLVTASLVPLGIPTIWQRAAVGALLIAGILLQTAIGRRQRIRPILDAPAPEVTNA
ncbi:ABC transporter permease [Kribbella sandramycini]|uniref:ABC transporter permease n=1 Tax=Kribbella sandramycini TaxID=60450 RepID=A0A7Y4NZB1_9ACTN|nr:ABC transporter permease [Kribbella sandramycini]MBB6567582.1 simple sugar transport system permease protein [Kribbella sandramycini]NOL39814.1 ABC transporter permease [Kribbella sandramycini]